MLKFIKYFVVVVLIIIATIFMFLMINYKGNIFNAIDSFGSIMQKIENPTRFEYKENIKENFDFDSIEKFSSIEVISDRFNIHYSSGAEDKIVVEIDLLIGAKDRQLLKQLKNQLIKKVYKRGKTLIIEVKINKDFYKDKQLYSKTEASGDIYIRFPSDKKFENIDISSISSDIEFKDYISVDFLKINVISGDINIKSIKSKM